VIDKSRLLSEADVVRGSGIFTGPVFVFRSESELERQAYIQNKKLIYMSIDREAELKKFDEKNPNGYCLIADTLQGHNQILALDLQNLRTLVTVNYASRFSHPLKVVSEMGIFYLGILGRKDLLDLIVTGDRISIASNQSTGIVYDLEKKKISESEREKITLTKIEQIKFDDAIGNAFPNCEMIDGKLILSATGRLGVYFSDYNEEDGIPKHVVYKLINIKDNSVIARGEYRPNRVRIQYSNFPDLFIDLLQEAARKSK
jgi:hypothetical protein